MINCSFPKCGKPIPKEQPSIHDKLSGEDLYFHVPCFFLWQEALIQVLETMTDAELADAAKRVRQLKKDKGGD